ncbi:MAG: LysM peptidoglycan-binding domain-containing protein [Gracilibacteraceae bacterium]|jgi:hypothetical protein|nr:LysM peptidoglycan-binding domain-containing protein [Gracilibacteraceae bacterium]
MRKQLQIPDGWRRGLFVAALALSALLAVSAPQQGAGHSYDFVPALVESGDTLWALTAKHNQGLDSDALIALAVNYNQLNNTNIQAGQIVYIPVRARP